MPYDCKIEMDTRYRFTLQDDVLTSQEERIDIFLRLQLVGYVFKQVLKKDTAEAWALVLFQLMLRGVITPTRNL